MTKGRLLVAAVAAFTLGVLVTLLVRSPGDRATSTGEGPASGPSSASAHSSTSPTTAASGENPVRAENAAGSGSRIETTASSYFGRPFETIQIGGRYLGVHSPRRLHVELRQRQGWTQFPLPTVTEPSGRFRAYVELGLGVYRLRLVDRDQHRASRVVTVLVF
ncbi:MAG TPA: hypothetical protein VFX33_03695 [Actinomycetales bacterium]|jgi:hypothetical protein|nr:hypothetical protein [Actinomycetales bacterium]